MFGFLYQKFGILAYAVVFMFLLVLAAVILFFTANPAHAAEITVESTMYSDEYLTPTQDLTITNGHIFTEVYTIYSTSPQTTIIKVPSLTIIGFNTCDANMDGYWLPFDTTTDSLPFKGHLEKSKGTITCVTLAEWDQQRTFSVIVLPENGDQPVAIGPTMSVIVIPDITVTSSKNNDNPTINISGTLVGIKSPGVWTTIISGETEIPIAYNPVQGNNPVIVNGSFETGVGENRYPFRVLKFKWNQRYVIQFYDGDSSGPNYKKRIIGYDVTTPSLQLFIPHIQQP